MEFNILLGIDIGTDDNVDEVEFANENEELFETYVLLSDEQYDEDGIPCLFCTSPWGGDCKLLDNGLFTALFNAELVMFMFEFGKPLFTPLLDGVDTLASNCDNC